MPYLTALLLVLTLTGSPVASIVCGLTCPPPAVATSHCHEAMPSDGPAVTSADNCSAPVLAEGAYVVEQRAPGQPATTVALFSLAGWGVALARVGVTSVHDDAGWLSPPLVLRL